nr:MAG TPA: hypothetical protein [Caudoviricetes sp.]
MTHLSFYQLLRCKKINKLIHKEYNFYKTDGLLC